MFIVGLNGSPRAGGNTAAMLGHAIGIASGLGAGTAVIDVADVLAELKVPFCSHCSSPCRGTCAKGNRLGEALDLLRRADGVLVGSPVYFGTLSGQLKAFWDKTRILRNEKALLNVAGAAMAVGASRYGGQENVLNAIYHMMLVQGMTVVGDGHWDDGCGHHGTCAQDPAASDTAWQQRMPAMVKRLVEVAEATSGLRRRPV
ncbi:NADPH-dependent FMN reductase [Clostridiales bacterium PH28_bin88]|nr:NADPH-dependent FMN reductase [Clostridiales bacterium PH28_bin88]